MSEIPENGRSARTSKARNVATIGLFCAVACLPLSLVAVYADEAMGSWWADRAFFMLFTCLAGVTALFVAFVAAAVDVMHRLTGRQRPPSGDLERAPASTMSDTERLLRKISLIAALATFPPFFLCGWLMRGGHPHDSGLMWVLPGIWGLFTAAVCLTSLAAAAICRMMRR